MLLIPEESLKPCFIDTEQQIAGVSSGDRWLLVEKDGRSAIVLKTTWESEAAAGNFFSAYRRGLRARFNSSINSSSM